MTGLSRLFSGRVSPAAIAGSVLAMTLLFGGCGTAATARDVDMTPADQSVCAAVCKHAAELEYQARLSKIEVEAPERSTLMKRLRAQVPVLVERCTASCSERGTRAQTTCIQSAKSLEELAACTKLPKRKKGPDPNAR